MFSLTSTQSSLVDRGTNASSLRPQHVVALTNLDFQLLFKEIYIGALTVIIEL